MAFDRATIPGELIKQINAGSCVLFVGAGMSIAAGLPDWPGLLNQMLVWCEGERVDLGARSADIKDRIRLSRLEEVAQTLREQMGEERFRRFMTETFCAPDLEPTRVHVLLPDIPFAGLLTTNYDKLIEEAYATRRQRVLPVYTPQDFRALATLPGESKPYLLKVHGDVNRPDTVVLGRRDYDQVLFGNGPFECYFTSLWQTKTLLFSGCGFEDRDINQRFGRLSVIFEGHGRRHFALMSTDSSPSGWRKQFDRNYNIHVIPYDKVNGHCAVGEFFNELKSMASGQASDSHVVGTMPSSEATVVAVGRLSRRKRPLSVIETATAKSYASAYMAAIILSEAARNGKRLPDDVQNQLAGLPGLEVDFGSFQQLDGYDVIFRMWLTGTDGRRKEVWARAGTADTRERAGTLVAKLRQAIADLGGGGMPPSKPPRDSPATGDAEGSAGGKHGDVLISRVGFRSLVVFGNTRPRVAEVEPLTGRAIPTLPPDKRRRVVRCLVLTVCASVAVVAALLATFPPRVEPHLKPLQKPSYPNGSGGALNTWFTMYVHEDGTIEITILSTDGHRTNESTVLVPAGIHHIKFNTSS